MAKGNGLSKYKVCFAPVKDMTLGEVFGVKPIPVTEMTKGIWKVIKDNKLGKSV